MKNRIGTAVRISDGMQLSVHPAFGLADQAIHFVASPPLFNRRLVAVRYALVDHHRLWNDGLRSQTHHHPRKGRYRLQRLSSVFGRHSSWRIAPAQAIATDEDDLARVPPVIGARLAVALVKEGSQARHLHN